MKIAASILSILVLLLTCVPCCAFDACEEEVGQEQSHNSTQNDCESCSPFLNCGGCNGFVNFQELPMLQEVVADQFSEETSNFQLLSQQEYLMPIWQPPRYS